MTHVTCRLTAKYQDELRNPALSNWVLATITFLQGDVAYSPPLLWPFVITSLHRRTGLVVNVLKVTPKGASCCDAGGVVWLPPLSWQLVMQAAYVVSILNQCRGPCPPVCLSQGQHDRQQQSHAVAGNAYDTS